MAKEWGRKVHLLGGLMAGSTRELRIIALAEAELYTLNIPSVLIFVLPPVLPNFFSNVVTLDFFKWPVCQLLSSCCISKRTGPCPISRR